MNTLFLFIVMVFSLAHAQAGEVASDLAGLDSIVRKYPADSADRYASDWQSGQDLVENPDADLVRRRTWGVIVGNAFAVGLYGRNNWWKEGFNNSFRTVNEGWFGQNTYSGGADKLGHFYMNYAGTRLFARVFEWAGNSPGQSLQLAAWLTFGTYMTVEIADGFSKKWRFSKEDAFMNVAGVGAALLLENNSRLDRLLDLRLLYRPSRSGHHNFDPFGDYSGQTYLLVAKASGVPALHDHPWLRYVEVAIGYGSRGYSDNPSSAVSNRSRHVYAGISLNLSELLGETVFKGLDKWKRTQHVTDTVLELVQIPGTDALAGHTLRPD